MSAVTIMSPGMLTTVQDLGRWGFQSSGVSVAGPMDAYAHRLANMLVGNPEEEATLEVTLAGPAIECDDDRVIALTGAEFEVTIGSSPVPSYTAVVLPARRRLTCGRRLWGTRAYLAVSGGVHVPKVFGSRSTHLSSGLGGVAGRALKAGDRLPLGSVRTPLTGTPRRRATNRRDFVDVDCAWQVRHGHATVRVLPGPHDQSFVAEALATLQSSEYRVDSRSDRMGLRLHGEPLNQTDSTEMISEATTIGAIQVPQSGQPLLLMADRQTTGGYRTLATVITADVGLVGQLAPGDAISFVVCSRAAALAALIARERRLLAAAFEETA